MCVFMYHCIFKNFGTFFVSLFYFFSFSIIFIFNRTALINPGIVLNRKKTIKCYGYCHICKVYFEPGKGVEHCDFCGVCVEGMDHHCVCVGKKKKKNYKFSFYAMIGVTSVFYIYLIACAVMLYLDKSKRKLIN